ncbi:hypothetical protein BASA81_015253 [Batrachochytrium salamandrivorans]|nr:hypothetical protein BASA81_015253 [Batrachochytrium salamandrivorans]
MHKGKSIAASTGGYNSSSNPAPISTVRGGTTVGTASTSHSITVYPLFTRNTTTPSTTTSSITTSSTTESASTVERHRIPSLRHQSFLQRHRFFEGPQNSRWNFHIPQTINKKTTPASSKRRAAQSASCLSGTTASSPVIRHCSTTRDLSKKKQEQPSSRMRSPHRRVANTIANWVLPSSKSSINADVDADVDTNADTDICSNDMLSVSQKQQVYDALHGNRWCSLQSIDAFQI